MDQLTHITRYDTLKEKEEETEACHGLQMLAQRNKIYWKFGQEGGEKKQ